MNLEEITKPLKVDNRPDTFTQYLTKVRVFVESGKTISEEVVLQYWEQGQSFFVCADDINKQGL